MSSVGIGPLSGDPQSSCDGYPQGNTDTVDNEPQKAPDDDAMTQRLTSPGPTPNSVDAIAAYTNATDVELHLDNLARITATILGVPSALVSFVKEKADENKWPKSNFGMDISKTPSSESLGAFTAWSILPTGAAALVVESTQDDPRFKDNPIVTGPPNIGFYAGCPLVSPSSSERDLGTLFTFDHKARAISSRQIQALMNFSGIAAQESEFKAQQLKYGVKDAVVLVRVPETDDCCSVLYGNRLWTCATGAYISPPNVLPGRAKTSGPGERRKLEEPVGRDPILWDWLMLRSTTSRYENCKVLREACTLKSTSGCGNLDGTLAMVNMHHNADGTGKVGWIHVPVTCHFTPIHRSLDNAAAIALPAEPSTDSDNLERLARGHLCFVQISSTSADWKKMTEMAAF